jgi:hypothetical protein
MPVNSLSTSLLCRVILVATVFFAPMASPLALASEVKLTPGTSYKIIRPTYLSAVYESMDAKLKGKGPAKAYLNPKRYAKTRWVAYECAVPAGTIMTVIEPAPTPKAFWKHYDAYYVKLSPDPSRNLKVIVEVYLEFADASGELNAAFFEPVTLPIDKASEVAGCTEPKP